MTSGSPGNMELTLGELQEMASRQQHQIEINNQILQAREQRLKHLRQQCRIEKSGELFKDVLTDVNKLRNLRNTINEYKLNHVGVTSDLEILRLLCADKEQEIRDASERIDELNKQIDHLRRIKQQVIQSSDKDNQHNIHSDDFNQTELDRLRQELMIRTRLNEQQAKKIDLDKELYNQKQKDLLSIDSRLLQLTEHLCSRKFVPPKFTDIEISNADNFNHSICSPNFSSTSIQKSPKITFANYCNNQILLPEQFLSKSSDVHCSSVPNLRIDDDKLHMHLNVMNSIKKRHSITESEGSGYTQIPISLLKLKSENNDNISLNNSTISPSKSSNIKNTEESHKNIASTKKVRFDPIAILLDAAVEGELDLVIEATRQLKDPSQPNDEGITALHNAVCAGNFHCVEYLVKCGCDINFADNDGWTPLHCAASCNNLTMTRFLVENGAAIFAQTGNDNEIPEEKCELDEEGYEECFQYLSKIREQLGTQNDATVFVLYDHQSENADELSLKIGNKLKILRKGDSQEKEWWWAERIDNGSLGYVPRNYLGMYPRVQSKSIEDNKLQE